MMTVTITFKHVSPVTMSYQEWEQIGKEAGYCKANKIHQYQVTQISYDQ